jgi:hypothetical protein
MKIKNLKRKVYQECVKKGEERKKEYIAEAIKYDIMAEEVLKKEDSLQESRIPERIKVNALEYNLINYENPIELEQKILNSSVSKDELEYILPNLYHSLRINETSDAYDNIIDNNYSCKMSIELFFSLYKNAPQFLKNKDIGLTLDKYKNFMSKNVQKSEINSFSDIMVKDKFFTFIKNKESLKTVIFLAEIFTENSKDFAEVIFLKFRKVYIGLNIQ